MPLTQLDTAAALIVVDVQRGIAGLPTVHPAAEIIGRAARLARAFRERSLPVVVVNVTGRAPGRTDAGPPKLSFLPDWTELVPLIASELSLGTPGRAAANDIPRSKPAIDITVCCCHRRRHLSNHRTYGLLFRYKTLTTAQSSLTHKGLPRLIAYYTYCVVA